MNITVANQTFDHATYDAERDVLYLRATRGGSTARTDASPEGHALRYDAKGDLVGLTIVNAKWLLERDGAIGITLPERFELGPDALGQAFSLRVS